MKRSHWPALVAFLWFGCYAFAATGPSALDVGKTTIYRDDFGVPHIFADTVEHGLYAMAYAQAQDRLEELLKNYLRARGEMSEAFGAAHFEEDLIARVWDHYDVARRNADRINPIVRAHLEAFAAGLRAYMKEHPAEVPAWWGSRPIDIYLQIAHSRQFMWGWPLGQALSDLAVAGVRPDFNVDLRSSNEWSVAPQRTSVHAAILLIDPHLSWWGAQRFWEFRIHAGELHGSGFTLPGSMYVGLGHNDNVAWAMTTGGPDTSDIYDLTLNPTNRMEYRYDGGWRTLKARPLEIKVKGEAQPRRVVIYDSHDGPIIARKGDHAYAAKIAYAEEVRFGEAFYYFNFAHNVEEFRRGLELNQVMPQNVMAADTQGNIFYMRAGRVPIRAPGYDSFRPLDGSTSKTEWQGIHPARDLYQVLNPPQGYMQNCNIPPDVMMVDSPMKSDLKALYLFGEKGSWISQRGARAVQLLSQDDQVTPEKARDYALDKLCIGYDRWVRALQEADHDLGHPQRANTDYQGALTEISQWDGRSDASSTAALKFYYWRQALNQRLRGEPGRQLANKVNDLMAVVQQRAPRAFTLTEAEKKALVDSLAAAMARMRQEFGRMDRQYGDVFRCGRDGKSWPVGGGSLNAEGMGTLRAIGFEPPRPDHTRWGTSGQTSTQIVVLTKPIQSWTQPPIGESDHPDSPFYCDQAERLFSPSRMKPTWYAPEELAKHVYSRLELNP